MGKCFDTVMAWLKQALEQVFSAEEVRHICQISVKLISDSLSRRAATQKAEDAHDDDDDEEDMEGDGAEDELRVAACNLAVAVMEHYPDHFAAVGLPLYLPVVHQLLQPSACEDDQHLAVMIASGLCEHLGDRVAPHWSGFLPSVLEHMNHRTPDLKATACYLASNAAKLQAFAPFAVTSASIVAGIVSHARGQGKKKSAKPLQGAGDNALSALVQLLLNHKQLLMEEESQYWATWLAGLPCQEDEQEGMRNNKILLTLLQQESPAVVGEGSQNLPRIFVLLIDAYRTDMADEETSAGICHLLCSIDDARLQRIATSFADKQQKKLARIRRDGQQHLIAKR